MYLIKEAITWIKRKTGPGWVIQIVPDMEQEGIVHCYQLYTAYEPNPDYLGRILFDAQCYWIYDGDLLTIAEQERVAKFIINYIEPI